MKTAGSFSLPLPDLLQVSLIVDGQSGRARLLDHGWMPADIAGFRTADDRQHQRVGFAGNAAEAAIDADRAAPTLRHARA